MTESLHRLGIQYRVLLTTTLVLVTCLGLAGYVLDRSFRASIVGGAEEQLKLVIFSLMGAASDQAGALSFDGELPEPRLEQPESGLYALVYDVEAAPVWQSPSLATAPADIETAPMSMTPGLWEFAELDGHFALNYTVIWEAAEESLFVFSVITDQAPFKSAIGSFRRNLWIGLGAVMVLFVLAQLLAVRWGLRPLRTMAEEVRELEAGARERLDSVYPKELMGLAANLDRFIDHEQRNRARYRNAMDDLAHSLKTPLAVLRNGLSEPLKAVNGGNGAGADADARLLIEQLDRMENTVTHQLSRASMTGPIVIGVTVGVEAVVNRLMRALETAYRGRRLRTRIDIDEMVTLRIDERDFMEMLGNLLENAFKYTKSRVAVSASTHDAVVDIVIEDDGPGIDPAKRESVLHRGIRADTQQPGQGIGLSVVYELVTLYQGKLDIDKSALGGARVTLTLPV